MRELPYFVIFVRNSNDCWLDQYKKSWILYSVLLDKYNLTPQELGFIYDNTKSWINYIVNKYVHKEIGEEFYVSFRTQSFQINVKLTYFDK